MKKPVPIPGREKQNMVIVDFGNPFLRDYFPKWLQSHKEHLNEIKQILPAWAKEAREIERREATQTNRAPRPIAVVFDIDEVLLCNTHLNGFKAPAGVQGPNPIDFHVADFFIDQATGKSWGREDPGDPPLPGAVALLEQLAILNIQPFFITGRLESIRDITIEDFRRAGFTDTPGAAIRPGDLQADRGILVMCRDDEYPAPGESIRPFKEGHRERIEKTHRIMLNVGDQPSDLGLYGDRQYYLPHPFYSTY